MAKIAPFPHLPAILGTLAALVLTAGPALGWEATPGPVCELTHEGDNGRVEVTYDRADLQYAIAITPVRPWSDGAVFAIRFDGPQSLTITTDRHVLSEGGTTLTVTDSGFGNVLDGLEFNRTATALLGDRAVAFMLADAAPAVRAFRACTTSLDI